MRRTKRLFAHLFYDDWRVRLKFTPDVLRIIEKNIAEQEQRHEGELRFVVEGALPLSAVWRGYTARERALELFGTLGVWDTEANAGVLIYLLLAEKDVEIVADRGIHRRVGRSGWEAICQSMQREFSAGRFELGVRLGIQSISDLLAVHFPPKAENKNELSDKPLVM